MRFRRKRKQEIPAEQPGSPAVPGATGLPTEADLSGSDAAAAQVRRDLQGVIDRFGWAVVHGGGGAAGARYSHTVGLTAGGHPEVIVTGLPFEAGEKYLNLAGRAITAGARFTPGAATTVLTDVDSPVVFLAVTDAERLTVAEQFYGRPVEALQLVWPDSTGLLPWQEGHRNPPTAQPLLGPLPGDDEAPSPADGPGA
ncbi:DUF4262 domain-containing protein [Modestobacter sp. NPDC049651]|uniref:DUF4262 domain-containing protein n=1 Tax=unclassified Modestobacter TaxID=2643866 RepID=UPI0033FE33B3